MLECWTSECSLVAWARRKLCRGPLAWKGKGSE